MWLDTMVAKLVVMVMLHVRLVVKVMDGYYDCQ